MFQDFNSSIGTINTWINQLIPLVISIALILFLIGIVQFVTAGGDEEKRAAARGMIIFGIIALFVMISVWGFVNILSRTFFGNGATTVMPNTIPQAVPSRTSGYGTGYGN
ncbi:MAG: hypothetical protein V4469_02915 [Patescibacteria group bacterium]